MKDFTIHAPWANEVVDALNNYQQNGLFHPYTCGNDSSHILLATKDGWVCPMCGYKQSWAHGLSIDLSEVSLDDLFLTEYEQGSSDEELDTTL